jgi:hypothetical protein
MSDVYLGPVPCQGCRHPVSLLDDKRWHDDWGVHVCRPMERPAEPTVVRVIPPPYRQLMRGKRPRPEWECGDPLASFAQLLLTLPIARLNRSCYTGVARAPGAVPCPDIGADGSKATT